MELYEIYINNDMDYLDKDEATILIVAERVEDAEIKAKELLLEYYGEGGIYNKPYYLLEEIKEVDGFKITVSK